MNIVAHLTECKPNSTVASARVARFIVETLNALDSVELFTLVDTRKEATLMIDGDVSVDTLFIVNGPMAFCDFLEELAVLVRRAKNVIFVQQDYTIMPPSRNSKAESPFRKVFADLDLRPAFWTTVESNIVEPADCYINWNQLTYDPQPFPLDSSARILMYYGAYREKREQMFKKYFQGAPYKVVVSTTTLRGKKFKALDDKITIAPPFTGLHDMPLCSASLYIEDQMSSKNFHSPANRFYELLSAGIPIFFERTTLPMLARAGIVPKDGWVVSNKEQLYHQLLHNDLDAVRRQQRQLWDKDYVGELRSRLLALWREHLQTRK